MPQAMTLKQASEEYLRYLKEVGKSKMSLYTYGKDLEQIRAFWGAEKIISEITKPQVGKFLKSAKLRQKPNGQERAIPTIRKTVRVLRMFLFWAKEQGYIEEMPLPMDVPLGHSVKSTTSQV